MSEEIVEVFCEYTELLLEIKLTEPVKNLIRYNIYQAYASRNLPLIQSINNISIVLPSIRRMGKLELNNWRAQNQPQLLFNLRQSADPVSTALVQLYDAKQRYAPSAPDNSGFPRRSRADANVNSLIVGKWRAKKVEMPNVLQGPYGSIVMGSTTSDEFYVFSRNQTYQHTIKNLGSDYFVNGTSIESGNYEVAGDQITLYMTAEDFYPETNPPSPREHKQIQHTYRFQFTIGNSQLALQALDDESSAFSGTFNRESQSDL